MVFILLFVQKSKKMMNPYRHHGLATAWPALEKQLPSLAITAEQSKQIAKYETKEINHLLEITSIIV